MNLKLNNRNDLRTLNAAMQKALDVVAAEHGLQLKIKSGTYEPDGSRFTTKLEVLAPNESGEIVSKEAQDFQKYATQYDLKADDLGKTFRSNGHGFTISGMKPRSRKFPILATRDDGKTFKFTAEAVAQNLKR